MIDFYLPVSRLTLALFVTLTIAPAAAWAGDLSQYRDFRLGTDLPSIVKQAKTDQSQTKTVHLRPALIQDLEWHPQGPGAPSAEEAARDVVFSFCDGILFRIGVTYDRYKTTGLTTSDMVEAISATYGVADVLPVQVPAEGHYGDEEEVLAQWQDSQYRFQLIRSSYGPTFKLVGVLKRLETTAEAAALEAKRLDDEEAPQRDAARLASENEAAKATQEKARLVNKPKFRP